MNARERRLVFREALIAYRLGDLKGSARSFKRLLKEGSTEPRHVSYCGLLIAMADGKLEDGRILCELAVKESLNDVELRLNLARVYSESGNRRRALEILREGLHIAPRHLGLLSEIEKLNPRSGPPLAFLERKNPLNRYIGQTVAALSRIRPRKP
jgi:tetratricopeptide (TPR) repeat protein